MVEMTTQSPEEMMGVAKEIVVAARSEGRDRAMVLALNGDLGAGKTTLTQAIARELCIEDTVLSPTFVLERVYRLEGDPDFDHLIHIDAYRLDDPHELEHLGWSQIVADPRNLIIVEWADRVSDLLPADTMQVHLAYRDETSRTITF